MQKFLIALCREIYGISLCFKDSFEFSMEYSIFNNVIKKYFEMTNLINSIKDHFKQKEFSAHDAYMVAKYGKITTPEDLLSDFYEQSETLIKNKSASGQYCAMVEIDVDIENHVNDIIEHYKNLGFNVIKLTNQSTVDNQKLTNLRSTFIILIWSSLNNQNIGDA